MKNLLNFINTKILKNKKLWLVCATFAFLFLCLPVNAYAHDPNSMGAGIFYLFILVVSLPVVIPLLITLPFYIFKAPKNLYIIPAIINTLIFLFIVWWGFPGADDESKRAWLVGVFFALAPLIVACICFYISSGKILSISYALVPALLSLVFLIMIMPTLNKSSLNNLEHKLETIIKNKDIAQFNALRDNKNVDSYLNEKLNNGDREVFEFLLSIDVLDNYHLLCRAIKIENKEIAEFLIAKGAGVNAKDDNGETPLHYALGNKEIAELLIAKGADVNIKNNFGKTPLFYAIKENDKELAKFLIAKGADVNIKTKDGKTALDFAEDEEIKQLLISHGAKRGKDLK